MHACVHERSTCTTCWPDLISLDLTSLADLIWYALFLTKPNTLYCMSDLNLTRSDLSYICYTGVRSAWAMCVSCTRVMCAL